MKFNMRKLKYGSASVIFTALVIAIVIILNIVAQVVSDRFSLKVDMTEEGQFSLSDSTLKMLDGIEDEINIYILSTEVNMEKADQSQRALEMIQRYNTHSGGKIKYQFIDPNKNPQFFEKYQKATRSLKAPSSPTTMATARRTTQTRFTISQKSFSQARFSMFPHLRPQMQASSQVTMKISSRRSRTSSRAITSRFQTSIS